MPKYRNAVADYVGQETWLQSAPYLDTITGNDFGVSHRPYKDRFVILLYIHVLGIVIEIDNRGLNGHLRLTRYILIGEGGDSVQVSEYDWLG